MQKDNVEYKIIIIGGSAGSFQSLLAILQKLTNTRKTPICIVLHRLKSVRTGLAESLSVASNKTILEPFDNTIIEQDGIYIAPSNYHLLIETEQILALSTEKTIDFSRPSISFLCTSAAEVFKQNTLAILLSGANYDGVAGCKDIYDAGGTVIVQNPEFCDIPFLPQSAIDAKCVTQVCTLEQIVKFINSVV